MKIGREIKRFRKIRNIKQHELASKLNISQKHMSMIENNRCTLSWKLLDKILEALNVELGFIFKD